MPNVVGYQNLEVAAQVAGGYSYLVCTLPSVGKDYKDIQLKDLIVVPPEGGLTADISVFVTTFTSEGQRENEYLYIDQAQVDAGTGGVETPGWYTKESVDNWTPVSAGQDEIEAGRMFIISSDCGAKITMPSAL